MVKRKPSETGEESDEMVFETPGDSDVGAVRRHLGEDPEIADVEEGLAGELKKYKEKLKVCQKERQEYLDGWQRSKADYLNSKRRLETEREQETERNAAHFIEKLLPLCDSFDLALRDFQTEDSAKNEWRVGMEQIYNQLLGILKSYNVDMLDPVGALFDPRFHEAVSETPVTDPAQDHTVLEVLQKGYAVGEWLIRPAKIVVGNYKNEN